MRSFFSHGKILLIGEYAVMAGIEALALPVADGQWMNVWEIPAKGVSKLIWQSKEPDGEVWFECRIDTDIMHVSETTDEEISKTLVKLLREIQVHHPALFEHRTLRVENECEFNRNYGLGTSSTLVSNLSKWSGVDAFTLQKLAFGGSGYDVAVGQLGKPLVYWIENEKPCWGPWLLSPELTAGWFLAFPNKKQNSRDSLADVNDKLNAMKSDTMVLQQLNAVVNAVKHPRSLPLLEAMLEMWQALLSQRLDLPRAWDTLELEPLQGGLCKWLGAWGGDVILINQKTWNTYPEKFEQMKVKPWNEFVISR
jgi:hypothetical protein